MDEWLEKFSNKIYLLNRQNGCMATDAMMLRLTMITIDNTKQLPLCDIFPFFLQMQ